MLALPRCTRSFSLALPYRDLRPIATGLKSSILAGALPREPPRPLPPPRRPATRRRTAAGVASSADSGEAGVGGVGSSPPARARTEARRGAGAPTAGRPPRGPGRARVGVSMSVERRRRGGSRQNGRMKSWPPRDHSCVFACKKRRPLPRLPATASFVLQLPIHPTYALPDTARPSLTGKGGLGRSSIHREDDRETADRASLSLLFQCTRLMSSWRPRPRQPGTW